MQLVLQEGEDIKPANLCVCNDAGGPAGPFLHLHLLQLLLQGNDLTQALPCAQAGAQCAWGRLKRTGRQACLLTRGESGAGDLRCITDAIRAPGRAVQGMVEMGQCLQAPQPQHQHLTSVLPTAVTPVLSGTPGRPQAPFFLPVPGGWAALQTQYTRSPSCSWETQQGH